MKKLLEQRMDNAWKALMDIASMEKGHACSCQCANHAIECANYALREDEKLRYKETKEASCFRFHLPDMDRLFVRMPKWNWREKRHLSREWKELADSIRISMNYSPSYGNGDLLFRWHRKWRKNQERLEKQNG